jgi:hypothetical protein
MSKDLEERIVQLEKAHSRIFNQFVVQQKQLEELISFCNDLSEHLFATKKLLNQEKINFEIGKSYVATITEIVSKSEPVEWKNLTFYNYKLILGNNSEIYNAFVNGKYHLQKNSRIEFLYENNSILKQVRLY